MLNCRNEWTKFLDQGKTLDVIYIDFSKAFDSVSHEKLLYKLSKYGLGEKLIKWVNTFLCNRSQLVKIDGSFSISLDVTSGVPQGSILGPTFFLIYINDLCDLEISSDLVLFADDLKVFNDSRNHKKLQLDLSIISDWAKKWQLEISKSKSSVLYIGKLNPKYTYNLSDTHLLECNNFKDLGIIVTSDMSNNAQCKYIAKKASSVSNLILKCFQSKNTDLLIRAFLVYVRPILEYATVAWNPWLLKDIRLIENVQKRFTKRIMRNKNLNYSERLKFLNVESLELRRIYFDLSMLYSIINFDVLPFDNFFELNKNATRRKHDFKLVIPKVYTNIRKYDFSNRIINIWNALPESIVNSPNSKHFLTGLKKTNLSGYLRGPI